jgi:hypothetical protein
MNPRHERGRTLLRCVLATAAVLLAAGCGDNPHPTAPSREAAGPAPLTAADSAAYFARLEALGLARPHFDVAALVGTITVQPGEAVYVSILSMENGRCEDVMVTGAITATLFTGIGTPTACAKPSGTTPTAPATVAGPVFFHITSAGSTSQFTQTGAHAFTVAFEDGGGDNDYNDIVLSVLVVSTCNLFKDPSEVTDPLLNDPAVQQGLKDLWSGSNPLDPIANRREQGGYIVKNPITGQLSVVPYLSNQSPTSCTATIDGAEVSTITANGSEIVGYVHTHPYTRGTRLPPRGACLGYTDPAARFGDGPSMADKSAQADSPWPSYIIDPRHIHVLSPFQTKGRVKSYNRDQTCARG